MTEIKSIIRSPTKPNVTLKNERNVLFDEIAQIHAIDMSDSYVSDQNENDVNSMNFNNSSPAERVVVKVMDQPTKETIQYLDLNTTNELVNTDGAIETDTIKKRTPIIKVKVRLSKDSGDKINSAMSSSKLSTSDNEQSCETAENLVENSDKNLCNSEEQMSSVESTKHNVDNGCIFDENKSRPLSPIAHQFRAVEDLIDYHERQITRPAGRTPPRAPLMGTTALLNRSLESKLALDDSEIISALVRDRFVVNMFESRTYRRSNRKKPSNYGRIYKSLERTVCTDTPSNGELKHTRNTVPNIICVEQSSPIQLNKQSVSLHSKNTSCNLSKPVDKSEALVHNSCPPFQTNCDVNASVVLPSTNLSDKVIETLAETQNDNETLAEIQNDNETIENYSTETTAEMCNDVSSNAETDICESLLDSISNLSATSTVKTMSELNLNTTTTELNLITTEIKQQSTDSIEKLLDNSVSTDLSYNMEEFLEKALGEELCNYSNLDSTTDVCKKQIKELSKSKAVQEDSVCTSDASDLVSKINSIQSNFYRSLTKKLQHMSDTLKFPNTQKEDSSDVTGNDLSSIFPNNEEVTALVQQAAVQYEAMKQITKALTLCRNMKEFCVSSEQIEGERLLLVATYKRQAILDEIRRLDYELDDDNDTVSMETGTLMISGVSMPLKDDTGESVPVRREQKYWYVCIFSYGPRVVATQPALATSDGIVKFSEEIIFTELPSDFTINLEVYCLLQRRSSRNFSHESKYHINKTTKSSHCPAPKKFLHREKLAQKNATRYDTGIRPSSFKLCGCLKLRVADLAKPAPWYMRKIPLCSALTGAVTMNLQRYVQIPIRHAGFLTVGTESAGCTAWNRRWCVVDGPMVRFWNYPSDEDTSEALHEVDLKHCANARIESADRRLCARARTLLLETVTGKDIHKHFLSTDTAVEMKIWQNKLNTIVSALRTWNVAYF